jgi:hypothetical protein
MSKRAKISPKTSPTILTPFNYQLVGMEKNIQPMQRWEQYCVTVTFSIPAEGEECPLTLELISESKLSFMPVTPFLLDRPKHCKVTLPCGHAFSALTLMYSFCKNYMTCPCCRSGKQVKMDVLCLPKHLRVDIRTHIQQTTRQEEREDEDQIINDLITTSGFVSVLPYSVLAGNDNLELMMEFFNTPRSSMPLNTSAFAIFSMTTHLRASGGNGNNGNGNNGNVFLEPRTDLRGIANVAHMGVNAIRLSVHLNMRGTGRVAIDATAITQLPHVSDENSPRCLTIPGMTSVATTQQNGYEVIIQLRDNNDSNTRFSVFFSQSAASPFLTVRNINWHPGTETLAIMSNNTGFAAML